jgi:hypothetical protein
MYRVRWPRPDFGRAGPTALVTGVLVITGLALAGCHRTGTAAPSPGTATASASASPGLSIPGTHRATTTYQVSAPVSTVVVDGHVGNVTVTGGSGPVISVTQQADYSRTPPMTTRTVSGNTLTVTYSCPAQVVCGVAYTLEVPRSVAVQVTAGTGAIRLAGLAGNVTARADVGLISATGLTTTSASLTTSVGAISASFAAAPATVLASARVGAITLRVPGTASYKVTANAHVGRAAVSIPQSPSSTHAITATTDIGAIDIVPSS